MITLTFQKGGQPLYMQLYRRLKEAVRQGEIAPRQQLPSRRKLAAHLGVSVSTVDAAYAQLLSEGFIESRPKQGYYACQVEKLQERQEKPPELSRREVRQCRLDFSASRVDTSRFPTSVWRKLLRSALESPSVLRRSPPQGDASLRSSIAQYLYGVRGIQCDPACIVIGAGTDNLIHMLSYIFDSAFIFAMENPVYNKAYQIFARMGHKVVPIEVDGEGIRPALLPNQDRAVVYATPSHQFPLGMTVPINRRIQLLNWAKQGSGRYIIEDDYDSEFRYRTRPIPPIYTLDGGARVIYLGTFSKTMAPSIRISYMVLPRELAARFDAVYSVFGSTVSTLEQAALDRFIRQGHYERHLNRMRKVYGKKRDALLARAKALGLVVEGAPAGHHILLKAGGDSETIIQRLRERDVGVYSIQPYFIGPVPEQFREYILLGFGALEEEEIAQGLGIIRQVMEEAGQCG